MAEEPLSFRAFVEDELRRNPNQTTMNAKRKYKGYKADFLANQEALSKESAPDPVTTTQPSLMQQALDKEVEAKELMTSGGDFMSAMREALALKVKAEQEAANPVTTQEPIDQGIGSAPVLEQGIPIEPPGLSILEKLKKDGGLPIGQVGGDQTDPITDPAEEKRLLEALIGDEDYQKKIKDSLEGQFQKIDFNAVDSDPVRRPEGFNPGDPGYNPAIDPIFVGDENKIKLSSGELVDPEDIDPLIEPAIVNPFNPKPPNPQEYKDKYSDLDQGFFDAPEFQDYLSAGNGIGTMDMYNSPYFGMGGSGSIGKAQDRAYEAYLDRIKSADAAPVVTDPVADAMGTVTGTIDPSQITLGGGRDWSQRDRNQIGPLPKGYYSGPADGVYKYGEGPYAESTQKFLDEQGMTWEQFNAGEKGYSPFQGGEPPAWYQEETKALDQARKERNKQKYGFDQFSSSTQDPTDPIADMDPTQIDPVLTPDTGQAGGSPPATTTPAVPGTEVVPANPTAPPTTSAPATETPGIPNLSDGLGAQLKQLFEQYMGSRQQYPNNYSRPLVRPMDQYRTAVTDTDEYKAYNDYASSLGPTEEQRAELQRLQSAFEGTDAYGQFNQQRQQRRNYMQPLGYGGGYGGGYGSGYGGGFQGGFGGYGGGYGGYQQPSYQQPYYQPPMQQQPYYGGGIMGGSSYGYPNNYSSYQQPYQQPYQMAQQYQQQPAYQSYGSVQPQYPTQYSSYASPFANSIR
jgi:hypothetical protein